MDSGEPEKLCCQLTSPELRQRKNTVLKSLQVKILERKELENIYMFRFEGTDELLDELNEFIKTERACCHFFTFTLKINGATLETWMHLTGPKGVREFIRDELGFLPA